MRDQRRLFSPGIRGYQPHPVDESNFHFDNHVFPIVFAHYDCPITGISNIVVVMGDLNATGHNKSSLVTAGVSTHAVPSTHPSRHFLTATSLVRLGTIFWQPLDGSEYMGHVTSRLPSHWLPVYCAQHLEPVSGVPRGRWMSSYRSADINERGRDIFGGFWII